MTKRRDRNRKARRRRPKRYIIRWTDETLEDLLAEPAARILTNATERKTDHDQAAQTDRGRTGI